MIAKRAQEIAPFLAMEVLERAVLSEPRDAESDRSDGAESEEDAGCDRVPQSSAPVVRPVGHKEVRGKCQRKETENALNATKV